MLALAADENFNNDIVRGLLRRRPDLNFVRVQDEAYREHRIQRCWLGRHRTGESC